MFTYFGLSMRPTQRLLSTATKKVTGSLKKSVGSKKAIPAIKIPKENPAKYTLVRVSSASKSEELVEMAEMVKKIQRSRQAATVSFPGIRLVNKSEAFNRFFFDHFETEAMAQSHSDFDLILRNLSEKYKSLSAVESKTYRQPTVLTVNPRELTVARAAPIIFKSLGQINAKNIYLRDFFAKLKAESTAIEGIGGFTQKALSEWQTMSGEEKKKYEQKADHIRIAAAVESIRHIKAASPESLIMTYANNLNKYLKAKKSPVIKLKKGSSGEKKPAKGFALFLQTKSKQAKIPFKDAAKAWQTLTQEEKAKYSN